jgi:NADH-quinone oxidoreductase subunit B
VEIKREPLPAPSVLTGGAPIPFGATAPAGLDFRSRQLLARDMLRGELEDAEIEKLVEQSIMTTTLDRAVAWARGNSFFPLTFGLACCAIEMMSIVGARVDIARFGFEAFRASPRQADLILLSGRVSIKMAPVVRRIYDQMLEPKYAISMGACCSSMGVFNNYALVPSDKFMPIDVHVPGCPPRPEALAHGILRLREKVQGSEKTGWRERYDAVGTEEVVERSGPIVIDTIPAGRASMDEEELGTPEPVDISGAQFAPLASPGYSPLGEPTPGEGGTETGTVGSPGETGA